MSTTPVDKRNFYLSLSIMEGQKIASSAGFSVPSPEVQESEIMDIISKWVVLTGLGIFETVQNCTEWMMDVVRVHNDLDDDDIENTKNVIQSFGMALVSHLVDNEQLILPDIPVGDRIGSVNASAIFNLFTFVIDDEKYDEEEDEEDE